MSAAALQNILSGIQAHNLTAANMRWLAEQLLDAADAEDDIRPYTIEELEARIAKSEDDVRANRTYRILRRRRIVLCSKLSVLHIYICKKHRMNHIPSYL